MTAAAVAVVVSACSAAPAPTPSTAPTSAMGVGTSAQAEGTNGAPPDATFPSEVAGMPVISVASADELLRSGKLDGQAVAVAGYYDQVTPSCPYPGR
ncbi:MAG: hypothetical protein HY262_10915, partial [Chloroflexi bacterium]|nr:hypothetical protein [Chloroflexota bacterium]